jgi:hypothetical protein
MVGLKRKPRVRVHLVEPHPGVSLPSVDGLLISKRGREYVLALPALIVDESAKPHHLGGRLLAIPRERVAFYEVLA